MPQPLMTVADVMTRDVVTCRPEDTLNAAARIMWEHDCGCVPVVDAQDRVIGMVTDRDICMAAYTQGTSLHAVQVASAMSRNVCACQPANPIGRAAEIMRTYQLRRLPVVDEHGLLIGMLSIGDLARHAKSATRKGPKQVSRAEIADLLAAISAPHGTVAAAALR